MSETRVRILDTAERLFAEQGYAATSLRQIIAGAGVNLAAVHYYFRSKEGLLEAVLKRRIEPVNAERLALLEAFEREASGAPADLERVLRAFLAPTFALARTEPLFVRMMGRFHAESDLLPELIAHHFGDLTRRFGAALSRALPHLPPAELYWRIHLALGTMAHTLRAGPELAAISGGLCDASDPDEALERLIVFLMAGFRARASVLAMAPAGRSEV